MKTPNFFLSKTAICFLLIAACAACKKENTSPELAQSLSGYVYAYTTGVISKAAPIKVRFAQNVASEDQIGSNASEYLSLNPKVAGEAVWEDEKTITFRPDSYLSSNTEYQVAVKLANLFDNVPSELETFRFPVHTKTQHLRPEFNRIENVTDNDPSQQVIIGQAFTSDVASAEELEEALTAEQEGRKLKVLVESEEGSLRHNVAIYGVTRGKGKSTIDIKWNLKNIGVPESGTMNFSVLSIDDFGVLTVRKMQEEEQYMVLNFSDPVSKTQDLKGLISLSDYNGDLRYIVDGNQVRIYTDRRLAGTHELKLNEGIKSENGKRLSKATIWELNFEQTKPKVRLANKGVILPSSDQMLFPFEATGLNAVEVEIFKIFNNNILQFLQENELTGSYDLQRVGRIVHQSKVDLSDLEPIASDSKWTPYALNLNDFITQDPQAIYQVRIGFRPAYSLYYCEEKERENSDLKVLNVEEKQEEYTSIMESWYGIEGYYEDFDWEDRENPCKPAYYNNSVFVSRNVVASNLGIIAKSADNNSLLVAISDLRTARPINNVELEIYDLQQQKIGEATTDGNGTALLQLPRRAFIVVAKNEKDRGYLRLLEGDALSLSRFDVAGTTTQKGMKGYLYGERGVWRPGDSLFLNFVLSMDEKELPSNYPITLELRDARGQIQERQTRSNHVGGIYDFHLSTDEAAPTGNWMATVKAGGATFTQALKVETVKPNRYKIELDFGKEKLSVQNDPVDVNMQVNWLYGAPAKNAQTRVEMNVEAVNTTFDNYRNYEFDDPARSLDMPSKVVFDGPTNAQGTANFQIPIIGDAQAPGRVRANFMARAFEPGGDFSIRDKEVLYDSYERYAGIAIPTNKYEEKRLDITKEETLRMVLLNANGQPVSNQDLSIGLYRVEWRWWWDEGNDNLSRYNSSQHRDAMAKTTVTTNNKGEANWKVEVLDWGRYMVRVCDTKGGHCTGDFFYAGYPWYDDNDQNREAAAMIAFSTDKEEYEVGETVQLSVPASEDGYAYVSIEDGTRILNTYWQETTAGDNIFEIETTAAMAPNVYAHVSLVQPHGQKNNDLPIRMYGVASILVNNSATVLQPVLKMPNELKPEQTFTLEVAEANNQPMAYTIALVDEGLLDLTNFKTPNPHDIFYAKEALGVQTWDVYNEVIGGYAGALSRILSIGGDGVAEIDPEKQKVNRFPPVVRHLGPFYLQKGKATHQITLPNYVGSVRAMVVAANANGAYGNTEKAVAVKSPLMVLATLPRVLGVQENLQLPVTIFADPAKVKNVQISLRETSGLAGLQQIASQNIRIQNAEEQTIYFNVQLPNYQGNAQFVVEAKGNGLNAKQAIEIEIRNPNTYATDVASAVLESRAAETFDIAPIGVPGSNSITLEVSNIPPLNLGERLQYLIRYPHGCIEQTVSAAFPQLYVNQLLELNKTQQESLPRNVQQAIQKMKQFQLSDGSFTYWAGANRYDAWGTNYAGHFLLEAKAKGYQVPNDLLRRWTKFQERSARDWERQSNVEYLEDLTQAYRLYTLALANEPNLAAMNRMRESANLSLQARWRLATAYALVGKSEVANEMIANASTQVKDYRQLGRTYGSDLRDQAMIVESLVAMNDRKRAAPIVQTISRQLSQSQWLSTQETAYSLLAISKFVGDQKSQQQFQFDYVVNGRTVSVISDHPMVQIEVPMNANSIEIQNTHSNILYARLLTTGQPEIGAETALENNLVMEVRYTDSKGEALDVGSLAQGTDFIAEVTVRNPGSRGLDYKEMALTQVFPSGWEISNTRLSNQPNLVSNTPEYRDFRDDRVHTYFDLPKGATQVYRIRLTAAYEGRYYLSGVHCSAMYDNDIQAREIGKWVEVVRDGAI